MLESAQLFIPNAFEIIFIVLSILRALLNRLKSEINSSFLFSTCKESFNIGSVFLF